MFKQERPLEQPHPHCVQAAWSLVQPSWGSPASNWLPHVCLGVHLLPWGTFRLCPGGQGLMHSEGVLLHLALQTVHLLLELLQTAVEVLEGLLAHSGWRSQQLL